MAYKFQLGAAIMSGALQQEGSFEVLSDVTSGSVLYKVERAAGNVSGSGTLYHAGAASFSDAVAASGSITAGTSFIIGSADLNETDMEKLDGITNGTAAANKALVLDGSSDISGINDLSAASLTASADLRAVNVHATTEAYLASAVVADLTDDRIVFAGTGGALEDNAALTFDGTTFKAPAMSGSGVFHAVGAATFGSSIAASGSITAVGVVAGGAISSATDIDGTGDLTMGTITMSGFSVDADGDTVVKTLSSSAGVTAASYAADGDITLGGKVTAPGASVMGSISGSGGLQMVGNSIFGGALNISGNLQVDGTVVNFPNVAAAGLDAADLILSLDSATKDLQARTRTNFASDLAGDGLSAASGVMALDLNELSAATVNVANDSIAIIDADDSNGSKKESIADLVNAIAGAGLSATDGVLSTDAAVVSAAFGDEDKTLVEGLNFGNATLTQERVLTLPASPSTNDVVRVKAPSDMGGFDLVIRKGANAQRIDGEEQIRLESAGGAVTMQYVGSNNWVIY